MSCRRAFSVPVHSEPRPTPQLPLIFKLENTCAKAQRFLQCVVYSGVSDSRQTIRQWDRVADVAKEQRSEPEEQVPGEDMYSSMCS